eukprot:2338741-Pyramimonas_sp.AAC.1
MGKAARACGPGTVDATWAPSRSEGAAGLAPDHVRNARQAMRARTLGQAQSPSGLGSRRSLAKRPPQTCATAFPAP